MTLLIYESELNRLPNSLEDIWKFKEDREINDGPTDATEAIKVECKIIANYLDRVATQPELEVVFRAIIKQDRLDYANTTMIEALQINAGAVHGRVDWYKAGVEPLPVLGIKPFQKSLGPSEDIKFVGLLGFTNHGKSALLLPTIYNMARSGHNVLFVPMEPRDSLGPGCSSLSDVGSPESEVHQRRHRCDQHPDLVGHR